MPPLPTTDAELKILGYIQMDNAKCSKCHAPIVWYRTPNRKLMPMNRVSLVPHWASCPFATEFKRKKS